MSEKAFAAVLKIAAGPAREDEIIQLIDDLLTVLRRGEPKDDYFERRSREALAESSRACFRAALAPVIGTHQGTRTKQ